MTTSTSLIPQIKNSTSIQINEDFNVSFVTFVDNSQFYRSKNFQQLFIEKQFLAPSKNRVLSAAYENNVEFGCYETLYVCIGGNAEHVMSSSNNVNYSVDWNFGDHNLENGSGYLPKKENTLICNNNFTLCTLYPTFNKTNTRIYNFEILKEDTTLNKNINFAHVAYGAVSIGDQVYTQQANIFNLTENTRLSFAGESIVILGYTI
jgi:hypothetical protein